MHSATLWQLPRHSVRQSADRLMTYPLRSAGIGRGCPIVQPSLLPAPVLPHNNDFAPESGLRVRRVEK